MRYLAIAWVLGCTAFSSAWANAAADGFVDLKGVPDDEAWSGGVLKTVFSTLGVHVGQFTYENPGPHELRFTAKLFVDHDEQSPIEVGGITGPMELEEEDLSLTAVIREGEDSLSVTLRAPEGSSGGTTLNEHLPKGSATFGSRMRNQVALNQETPIYCFARTDKTSNSSVRGRSDSHVVATYEWVIIVYVEVSPLEGEE